MSSPLGSAAIESDGVLWSAGVWVGAQADPLVVFVGAVSELGWG